MAPCMPVSIQELIGRVLMRRGAVLGLVSPDGVGWAGSDQADAVAAAGHSDAPPRSRQGTR